MEPLNKGHIGNRSIVPCRKGVLISEVKINQMVVVPLYGGSPCFRVSSIRGSTVLVRDRTSVICTEVVLISECPLSEVPLY